MTPLLLPWLVRQIEKPDFLVNLRKMAAILILLPAVWTIGLALFGKPLLEFAYEGKYQTSNLILALLGATTMVSALVLALSAAIKAHSQPKLLVRGYCFATILCLIVGVPLMIWHGILGVVIGMVLAACGNLVVLFFQLTRLLNSNKNTSPAYAS